MSTTIQYSFNLDTKQEMPNVVILDKTYDMNSTSTTTTNSPVISSHHLQLSSCGCNELITSNYSCSDCQDPFIAIEQLHQETDTKKQLLSQLQKQQNQIDHQHMKQQDEICTLKDSLIQKQETIETMKLGIESLHHDLKILKIKCKEETGQVYKIQESKENIEKELLELTIKLSEEADIMIQIEKKEQVVLSNKNQLFEKDIQGAEIKLKEASSQLKLIRNKIEDNNTSYSTLDEQPQQKSVSNLIDTYTRAQVETILMHGLDLGIFMDTLEDDAALMDFNDFIQTLYKTPLRKLNSLKYMRYCIRDDIDPCLRFGPNPRITSKKIIDAIMVKSCFIEECPIGFVHDQAARQLKEEASASLWERFTTSTVFLGCQACGRNMDKDSRNNLLKYRFRISYFDEWACIDRYCRDRLLAVIEFYLFIRHLRAGAYKHRSLHELYQQFIRLKLQMFLTRMGALPNMLQTCGINMEKIATAFHGEDVNNSVILLSDSTFERLSSSTESTITISTVESSRTSASSS
ncbi:hypothetical protein EDC94DRAFT_596595 [Helicostylum pulchrum]|uniref:GDP/GTP exchange factor Sec2 N-terminal domain-containing protein n=1 Tax=Helicostylum pulchrum TaxID=562976 RepID=A0ABP9YAM3_9FUNG|nr:hypothetical protein EDC94DRAFT_596595 [Helicostylum pulchrum]